nr:MAG TPA: U6 snRNA-associated Sm-like protein [Caudoviricetes sp.]
MNEAPHDPFAEFYRRRIAELQAALCEAQTVEEMNKIQRELDPYLKQIEKDEK